MKWKFQQIHTHTHTQRHVDSDGLCELHAFVSTHTRIVVVVIVAVSLVFVFVCAHIRIPHHTLHISIVKCTSEYIYFKFNQVAVPVACTLCIIVRALY